MEKRMMALSIMHQVVDGRGNMGPMSARECSGRLGRLKNGVAGRMTMVVGDDGGIGTLFHGNGDAHMEVLDHALEHDRVHGVGMVMKGKGRMVYRVGAVMTRIKIVEGKEMAEAHMVLAPMLEVMRDQLPHAQHLVQEHARTQDLKG